MTHRPPVQETAIEPPQGKLSPLALKIERSILYYKMFSARDRILVGVSGGPDSVALLYLLMEVVPNASQTLAIAHLDHGVRPESGPRETEWVQRLADNLGLPFFADRLSGLPRRGSLEAWLRQQRHGFLERTATKEGFSKIALGHQANDNAEAVLLHLLRGSGPRGIAGIPPVRGNRIVRPLIAIERQEILEYLDHRGIAWLQDPTNMDRRFERNRIRHDLIPMLERDFNPRLVRQLNRTASLFYDEDRWIDALLQPLLDRSIVHQNPQEMLLHTESLIHEAPSAQRRIIRSVLRQWIGDLHRFGADHIEQILVLLSKPDLSQRIHLPRRIMAEQTSQGLCFHRYGGLPRGRAFRRVERDQANFSHVIKSLADLPEELVVPAADLRLTFHRISAGTRPWPWPDERNQALFDLALLDFPLVVRNPRPGDRIAPFGMSGSQKVRKLFIDKRIPRRTRPKTPLLLSGDTIVWVIGLRRSNHAPVGDLTREMLHIEAEAMK